MNRGCFVEGKWRKWLIYYVLRSKVAMPIFIRKRKDCSW
jgi:hypothetical protein